MATIRKPRKKNYTPNPDTKEAVIKKEIYNTQRWRNLRKSMLMIHPLCQNCLKNLAIDVHHIKEISSGETLEEMKELAFDSSNLICLCQDCHKAMHKHNKKKKGEEKDADR